MSITLGKMDVSSATTLSNALLDQLVSIGNLALLHVGADDTAVMESLSIASRALEDAIDEISILFPDDVLLIENA